MSLAHSPGAMALLSSNAYDLVIADAQLEEGDGLDGLDIANAAKSRGVKAMMLTGYAPKFPLEVLEQTSLSGQARACRRAASSRGSISRS
jgi:CheY-like chemotaxis protein